MAVIAIVGVIGIKLHNQHSATNSMNDITLANLEAILGSTDTESGTTDPEKGTTDPEKGTTDPEKGITDPEKGNTGTLDANYVRKTKNCEMYVGANAKVSILGLGLVQADANGMISFPEQVTCKAGGDETCRPIECIDLLMVILGGEKS